MKTKQKKQKPKVQELLIVLYANTFSERYGDGVLARRYGKLTVLSGDGINNSNTEDATDLFQRTFKELMNDTKNNLARHPKS